MQQYCPEYETLNGGPHKNYTNNVYWTWPHLASPLTSVLKAKHAVDTECTCECHQQSNHLENIEPTNTNTNGNAPSENAGAIAITNVSTTLNKLDGAPSLNTTTTTSKPPEKGGLVEKGGLGDTLAKNADTSSSRFFGSALANTANEYILLDTQLALPEFIVEVEYIYDKVLLYEII